MKKTAIALTVVVTALGASLAARQAPSAPVLLEAARKAETVDGDLKAAITQYEQIVKRFPNDRAVVADALVRMAGAYRKLGDAQAKAIYERVVREYGDQAGAVSAARAALIGGTAAAAVAPAATSMRLLWEGPDVDTSGQISPDGRFLAFVDWSTGDLALRDVNAKTSRRLTDKGPWTKSAEYAERAVFSRDGRFIAYSWYTGSGATGYEIRILDLQATAGEAFRRVVPGTAPVRWCMPHDWSSDGRWLALSVTQQNGHDELLVFDLRTAAGTPVRVIAPGESDAARFSPDGRALAFQRQRADAPTDSDILVAGIDDGRATVVRTGGGLNMPLAWTSDGHLLFWSTRKGRPAVWLQSLDGRAANGEPILVKADLWAAGLGVMANGGLVMGTQPANQEIHTASLDSTGRQVQPGSMRTFEALVGNLLHPAWSPDGRYLAYVSRGEGGSPVHTLGVMDTATGAFRVVTPAMALIRRPRWAPDGRSVVVQGMDVNERQGLYRIDVASGAVTLLVAAVDREGLSSPQLSPDGNRLFYIRRAKECAIVERDLQAGQERQASTCDGFGRFAISPDGKQIAQARAAGGAQRLDAVVLEPLAGGPAREIYRQPTGEDDIASVSWMPDGSHVIVVRTKAVSPAQREALLVPVAGGPPTRLDLPPTVNARIDVHPDGKQLAFEAGERRQEVWVLENFLPAASKALKK